MTHDFGRSGLFDDQQVAPQWRQPPRVRWSFSPRFATAASLLA
jgi:hypothetical protein